MSKKITKYQGIMNKEEPSTTLFFNGKIARVIFEADPERKIYWVDSVDIFDYYQNFQIHGHFHYYIYAHSQLRIQSLPIQEWIEENQLTYPFDENGRFLFELTWS